MLSQPTTRPAETFRFRALMTAQVVEYKITDAKAAGSQRQHSNSDCETLTDG